MTAIIAPTDWLNVAVDICHDPWVQVRKLERKLAAHCESAGTARQTDMQDTAASLSRDFCEGKHAANEP